MKTIYPLLAVLAVTAMAGCKKTDVGTTVQVPAGSNDRVPVLFGLGQPEFDVSVKSVGGLEQWGTNDLYIFGYATDAADYTEGNAFIYNVKATTKAESGDGQILEVLNPAIEGEPFYYNPDNTTYDFYGYHVDDAAPDVPEPIIVSEDGTAQDDGTTLNAGVYVPFTINGSQDLMTAKADKTADIQNASPESSVAVEQAYSAFAARKGVQPNLNFGHRLSRFVFQVKSGSTAGNDVLINSISLTSPKKGYLCVIGNEGTPDITIAADDTPEALSLMQLGEDGNCTGLTPTSPAQYTDAETPVEPARIGESIMVIPGQEEYELTIETSMSNAQTPIEPQTYTLTPANVQVAGSDSPVTAFEAGKQYNITITIYGLEEVQITATLGKWIEGGNIEIDPDVWQKPGTEDIE